MYVAAKERKGKRSCTHGRDHPEMPKGTFEIIDISVFSTDDAAKKLYTKFGFKPYGFLPRSTKRGYEYIDEDLMYLDRTL
jgi:RimJ/RimL family protein N-acetyltransferase